MVCSPLGSLGSRKLYILGVVGYVTPIWDVLALEGEQEEAAEHIDSPKLINFFPIRQLVPVGLAQARICSWASWASFFAVKNVYMTIHSVFTLNILFYTSQGRQEWVDGGGWVWMSFLF